MTNSFNLHKPLVRKLYKFSGQQLPLFGATCGVAVITDSNSYGSDWGEMCEVRDK
jgi:hypothetical protein